VDFADYTILASYWLENECGGCGGTDLTCDKMVDFFDLWEFTGNWLTGFE
jgi:hypothetical protein